jgi:cobalt-zinc-cadmium efflux system membrane fusion protein
MRPFQTHRARLLAGAAVAVLAIGGAVFLLTRDGSEPAVAEAAEAAGAPEAPEGVVLLTAEQIQASGISVVAVGQGGGGEVRLSGRVEPMIDARAAVAAPVGGRVERVLVAPGQAVRAGQVLAVVVSGDAAVIRADADAASASADAARSAYQRDRRLAEEGVVARQDVETAHARYLGAEAAVRAARARAAASGAPNASGRLSVTTPISGVVTSVLVGPGGFAAQGGVVAEVADPARVELVFHAPPLAAAQVRVGQSLRAQGPGGEFGAVVIGVAAGAGGESGATVIRARPVEGQAPPAGASVAGVLTMAGASDGLTVPTEAVQTMEGTAVVFVQVEGGFRAAPVLTGRQAGGWTEILRGLDGDERIAAAGAFLLKAQLGLGDADHGH